MNKLDKKLHAIITKEIPEILELKFGCKVINKEFNRKWTVVWSNDKKVVYSPKDNDFNFDHKKRFDNNEFKIIGRDITLADVLRVMNNKQISIRISDSGEFYEMGIPKDIYWDLTKNLLDQSKETKQFILDIIS